MTANQTIDGVPRELLERCARELSIGIGPAPKNRAQELRALLDAESAPCAKSQVEGKRERFQKWVMATNHPVFGFLDGRSLARGDDRTGYADEYVQGLWVAYLAFGAEQPAPVAVAYQYRQRPLWRKDDNSGCMPWQDCSQEAHADYTASPDLHDWQYETRTLYAGPNQH